MSEQSFNEQPLEVERYELRSPPKYTFEADRREFVQVLSAGFMVAVAANSAEAQRPGGAAPRESDLTQRFHFGEDGVITVFSSKVEVGQGARTQLAQAAAEELRLPMERIRLVLADTARCPDDGGTAGSRTTPSTVPRVRAAAAAAREALTRYAAERLGAARGDVSFRDGIFHAGGKQLTLAELAADTELPARLQRTVSDANVALTSVERWRVLGTATPKVTGREVVTGAAQFPSDVVRPGMWYGKVLRPASFGATLQAIDLSSAPSGDRLAVVRDGDFVGCAAPTSFEAARACEALARSAVWNRPAHPSSQQLFTHLKRTARTDGGRRGGGRAQGNPDEAFAGAARKIDTQYNIAYIQHAPMEPRSAVAEWEGDRLTVWTGTQQPSRVQGELRQVFRLGSDQVRVIVPDTGGGFGGKHSGEVAIEAARLAKAAGRPVSLRWTREEEFTWAYFRPAGLIEVQAALDSDRSLLSWSFTNYNSGESAIQTPYRVPHQRTRFLSTDSPLRQGSYRALASTANAFARECAMDELAELAGADPLEFRLRHLQEERLKAVLSAAAAKFGWQRVRADKSPARGVGLACGTEKASYVAACAEVEVANDKLRVIRVCQAFECGAIQNPENLRAQVEGCLIMGLGGALHEEMTFENGQITNAAFSAYRVPRMADLPELDVVLVNRPDLPSVGGGETPIIAVAPAIANAIHHACGQRCRSLPLRLHTLSGQG